MKIRLVLVSLLAAGTASSVFAQDAYDALGVLPSQILLTTTNWVPIDQGLAPHVPSPGDTGYVTWSVPHDSEVTFSLYSYEGYTQLDVEYQDGNGDWQLFSHYGNWPKATKYVMWCHAGSQYRVKALEGSSGWAAGARMYGMRVTPVTIGDIGAALDSTLSFDQPFPLWWDVETTSSFKGGSAVKPLSTWVGATLRTTVEGPCTLGYESLNGMLYLYVDGTLAVKTGGASNWVHTDAVLDAGPHVVEWVCYSTSAYLDAVTVTPLSVGDPYDAVDSAAVQFQDPMPQWFLGAPDMSSDGVDSLILNSMGATSRLAGSITGPAVFRYQVKSESTGTLPVATLSAAGGTVETETPVSSFADTHGWKPALMLIPPGTHTVAWTLDPGDGGTTLSLDAFDVQSQSIDLATALNRTELTWTTGPGGYEWWGEDAITFDQQSAAASQLIPDSGQSWVETTVPGPGILSFRWARDYVASQHATDPSAANLTFTLQLGLVDGDNPVQWGDGMVLNPASGGAWTTTNVQVQPGTWKARWTVERTGDAATGNSLFFLDTVGFTQGPFPVLLPFKTATRTGNGMTSPWFGFYWDQDEPWIYSAVNGWLWVTGQDDSDVIYYDLALNEWFWTSQGFYRWIYCYGDGNWYYIFPHAPGTRVFYSPATGTYIDEADWGK